MARKKHEAEKKHALRKKEAPPVQDMPDETEHPALSEEKKPRVSKLLYRIIAALLIAVVLLIILENKDNLTPENIGNWIRTKAVGFGFGDGYPAELTGSTALVGNFGAADGNLYVVSDTALTVLNGSAKEMFSARHSYNDPAVSEASGRYLLYNAGGTGYRVETSSGTEVSGTSDSSITTGVICDSGKFALAVQPSDYASELRVYNKNGSLQYKYSFADSYITAVALNTDGTRAAVASTITHAGTLISRITVLDMSETEPIAEYESDGNLIFAVQWNRSGRVTAIGDTETLVSDTSYNFTPYAYDGRTVTAYTLIPSGAVVSVSNYAYGGDSTLLIFRDSAEPVESDLSGRAVWLSAAGNKVAALLSSSVVSTDLTTGRQEAACNVPADTKSIAMADESTVYLLGVREIRKENLKVIETDNTLSQTE